jgi:hypothetical protein
MIATNKNLLFQNHNTRLEWLEGRPGREQKA